MTKSESLNLGREHGTTAGLQYVASNDCLGLERHLIKLTCNALACDFGAPKGVVKAFYCEAFVNAFMAAWDAAYNAQPHVVAARRITRLLEYCAYQVQRGTDEVARFTANLTADRWDAASYAFEWGDNAAEAAAAIKVAKRVLAWYEQAKDVDVVLTEVRNAVQHGARFPKHSTSQLTNLMATNELAAYAAVLEACDR